MARPDCGDANWQIEPKNPSPREILSQKATQKRSAHRSYCPDCGYVSLITSSLAGRHDIRDGGLGQCHQPASTQALECAEQNQLIERPCHGAQNRCCDKNCNATDEEPP